MGRDALLVFVSGTTRSRRNAERPNGGDSGIGDGCASKVQNSARESFATERCEDHAR